VTRQPVRDHPAEEDERGVRDRPGGKHEAEFGPRAVQAVEHREGEPDRSHRAADERRRARRVQQPEASFAERA
jgi:hypothetical protein